MAAPATPAWDSTESPPPVSRRRSAARRAVRLIHYQAARLTSGPPAGQGDGPRPSGGGRPPSPLTPAPGSARSARQGRLGRDRRPLREVPTERPRGPAGRGPLPAKEAPSGAQQWRSPLYRKVAARRSPAGRGRQRAHRRHPVSARRPTSDGAGPAVGRRAHRARHGVFRQTQPGERGRLRGGAAAPGLDDDALRGRLHRAQSVSKQRDRTGRRRCSTRRRRSREDPEPRSLVKSSYQAGRSYANIGKHDRWPATSGPRRTPGRAQLRRRRACGRPRSSLTRQPGEGIESCRPADRLPEGRRQGGGHLAAGLARLKDGKYEQAIGC
jgi:hypothetical protein